MYFEEIPTIQSTFQSRNAAAPPKRSDSRAFSITLGTLMVMADFGIHTLSSMGI